MFEVPGTYRLKATLTDLSGSATIESNVLTIQVKIPVGEDAAAYEYLKRLKESRGDGVYYGNFLLTGSGGSTTAKAQKALAKKEEFISRFPNSRYARYVYYSLGNDYRLGVGKGVNRGVALLEKAASYKDFFLAPEALSALIDTFEERGDSRRADKYRAILAKRFPENPEGRDYLERSRGSGPGPLRYAAVLVLLGVAVGTFVFGLVPRMRQKYAK